MSYKDYINSLRLMDELTLSQPNESEISKYSKSDIHWVRTKNNFSRKLSVKKGEIWQFEFGKNPIPEMAYEHRGLIIGVANQILYVLPICSLKSHNQEHRNAYHFNDNPNSNSNFYLLKTSEIPFLKHDSVLKSNELKTISTKRLLYKHGVLSCDSELFKSIERKSFYKCFPTFSFRFDRQTEDIVNLTDRLNVLSENYNQLQLDYKMLHQEYTSLKNPNK